MRLRLRRSVERQLRRRVRPLTIGQWCADWYVLRRFHLTDTTGSKIRGALRTYDLVRHMAADLSRTTRRQADGAADDDHRERINRLKEVCIDVEARAWSRVWEMIRASWLDVKWRRSTIMKNDHVRRTLGSMRHCSLGGPCIDTTAMLSTGYPYISRARGSQAARSPRCV